MAAKTENKKVKKIKPTQPKSQKVKSSTSKNVLAKISQQNQTFSVTDIKRQIKLDESYISLVLGFGVVVVVFIVAIFFLKGENMSKKEVLNGKTPTPSVSASATPTQKGKTYVVQENESLWDIAVREYGDGYAYTKIIEANNFENPDYVPPGTKIIIPPAK